MLQREKHVDLAIVIGIGLGNHLGLGSLRFNKTNKNGGTRLVPGMCVCV